MRILLAADGSEYTKRAARHLVKHLGWFAKSPEVHLLHVRPPLPYSVEAVARAGSKAVKEYERAESRKALKVAEKVLDKAGIAYEAAWDMGDIAAGINQYVKDNKIDLIVIGSHGHGALANLALGSVATKVIATCSVPVLVVK